MANKIAEAAKGIGLPDSDPAPHRHPLGTGIGAVVAAGTACATGGVLVGPVGAKAVGAGRDALASAAAVVRQEVATADLGEKVGTFADKVMQGVAAKS